MALKNVGNIVHTSVNYTDDGLVIAISQNQYHIWELFGSYLGVICFRPKIKSFCKNHGQGTEDSQGQDGYCSLAENTQNATTFFGPICLPKPKSLGILKKSLWVSVRGQLETGLLCRQRLKKLRLFSPWYSIQKGRLR